MVLSRDVRKKIFDSTNLKSGLYRQSERKMYLQFHSGDAIYVYDDVPLEVWKELKDADSAGSYFNEQIRGQFQYHKLTDD